MMRFNVINMVVEWAVSPSACPPFLSPDRAPVTVIESLLNIGLILQRRVCS